MQEHHNMNNNNTNSTTGQRVTQAIIKLIKKENYYGEILSLFRKKYTDSVKTAGVCFKDGEFHLMLSPSFVSSLTDDELYGLLKHECLHVIFKHISKDKITCKNDGDKKHINQFERNIAQDTVINQYIDHKMLPKGGITLQVFRDTFDKNAKPFMHSQYYFDIILKNKDKVTREVYEALSTTDNHDVNDDSESGSGDENNDNSSMKNEMERVLFDGLLKKAIKAANKNGKVKGKGQSARGCSNEILDELITKDLIDIALADGKINWKTALSFFLSTLKDSKVETTRSKRNRRLGTLVEGTKKKFRNKILIGIDTSGSINQQDLKLFSMELQNINAKNENSFIVVGCDTDITCAYTNDKDTFKLNRTLSSINNKRVNKVNVIKSFKSKEFKFEGGGGTHYQPFFTLAKKLKCDGVILFGDMENFDNAKAFGIKTLFISNGGEHIKPKVSNCKNKLYQL